jgi:PAS domain S-box-containing protein
MCNQANRNILLVEDEVIIALSEKMVLEKYGYRVMIATSGETAVEAVEKSRDIELILMDIDLGSGIDGSHAAEIILRQWDLPVVFLSSHTEQSVVEKTEKITSYGYVVKNSGITILDASIKMAFKLFEARKRLSESEIKQSVMISNISDVIAIMDRNGRLSYISPSVERLFGWQPEEVLGEGWAQIHPDDVERVKKDFFALVAGEKAETRKEYRFRRKDGTYRQIELTAVNLLSDPILRGVLVNYHDITERKRAEESLATSEIRYRRLFEAAKDGILILDAETGKIVDVNPYLVVMLGFSKSQFLEKAIWEIGSFQNIIANQDNFLQLQDEEYIRYENLPLVTATGKIVEVEFVSNVYLVEGRRVIQCNIRNIMSRKRDEVEMSFSETRYRRLFETAQDGILILDAETGKIVDVNPYLVEMLGFSKSQFLEKAIWEIGTFKDIVASRDNFIELQRKEYIRYENLPLETASGKHIDVEFVSNVYLVDDRRVIQCSIRDITDRKLAEDAIKRLLAEKNLFLKEVHHRIKNNMITIKSLLDLQAGTLSEPGARKALEDAGSRVQTMMVLYDKLYRSVGFEVLPVRDYIPSLVDEILANFSGAIDVKVEKDIGDFELDTNKLLPLGIIINELLTNVMKYAFAGRAKGLVRISASLSGVTVGIAIEDDGKGIPSDIDFRNSTGFGLMLVEMLTKQLKGSIGIERGKGTRVVLTFDK